jgi:hypothetical protein
MLDKLFNFIRENFPKKRALLSARIQPASAPLSLAKTSAGVL